jgi:hypothetical protein
MKTLKKILSVNMILLFAVVLSYEHPQMQRTPSSIVKTNKIENRIKPTSKPVSNIESQRIYKKMSNFPHTSSPVKEGTNDSMEIKFKPTSSTLFISNKKSYKLSMSKSYYSLNEEVLFYVEAIDHDIPDNGLILATLRSTKMNVPLERVSARKYKGRINALKDGNYSLLININSKIQTLNFAMRKRYYEFKEVSEDYITSDGNLNFNLAFKAFQAGNYLLEGHLYYNNEYIANAHEIHSLENQKGTQFIDLEFYGKILSDRLIKGKLELRNITLSPVEKELKTINVMLISPNYKTKEYQFDQFNSLAFNNSVITEKLKFIEGHN